MGAKKARRQSSEASLKYPGYERLLVALAQHRVLDSHQLRRLVLPGTSRQWVGRLLKNLFDRELVGRGLPHGGLDSDNPPFVYWITPLGLSTVQFSVELRNLKLKLVSGDRLMASDSIAHMLATNEAALRLVEAAREAGGGGGWLNEVYHRVSDVPGARGKVVTDALVGLEFERASPRFFLEADRGTRTYDDICRQAGQYVPMRTYKRSGAEHPAWTEDIMPDPTRPLGGFPPVLFVFDCDNADKRLEVFAERISDRARNPITAAAGHAQEFWLLLTTMERLDGADWSDTSVCFDPFVGTSVNLLGQVGSVAA